MKVWQFIIITGLILLAYHLGSMNRTIEETGLAITGDILSNNYGIEKPSPKERINLSNIRVYNDKVVIYVDNPKWAIFTDTNSMDPVIDKEAKAIEIEAKCDDISIGDIVSYESKKYGGVIIHRVVGIGYDEEGKYFIFKGDNNPVEDPERVRCNQLRRVVIGILY